MVDGLEGFGDFHFSIALLYLNVTITCNLHAHIQHQGLSNMSVAGFIKLSKQTFIFEFELQVNKYFNGNVDCNE